MMINVIIYEKRSMKKKFILKTVQDKKIFTDAILNPPKATNKLKRAQVNHAKFAKSNITKE
jgi:hypothetical protein